MLPRLQFQEVVSILFNFEVFTTVVAEVYSGLESSYNLDDVLRILQYFFQKYEAEMGECHPGIKRKQIADIIEAMPQIWGNKDGKQEALLDLDPDYYPALIDQYFQTYFPHCNYRINHFFSGRVRELRLYEVLL